MKESDDVLDLGILYEVGKEIFLKFGKKKRYDCVKFQQSNR